VKLMVTYNGTPYEVVVEKNGGDYRVTVGETSFRFQWQEGGMACNGEFLPIQFDGDLEEGGEAIFGERKAQIRVKPIIELEKIVENMDDRTEGKEKVGSVVAPMPGKLISVKVKVGDKVQPNTLVAVLEAMKMENEILAGTTGTVKEIKAKPGENVEANRVLFIIE
jgi:biotin carboxyl carrier protein